MAKGVDWLVEEIVGGLLADQEAVDHLLDVTADELAEDLAYAERVRPGRPEVHGAVSDGMRVAWRRLRAVPAGEGGSGG